LNVVGGGEFMDATTQRVVKEVSTVCDADRIQAIPGIVSIGDAGAGSKIAVGVVSE